MPLSSAPQLVTEILLYSIAAAIVFGALHYPTKEQRRWYSSSQLNPWRLAFRKFAEIEKQDLRRLSRYGLAHLIILALTAIVSLLQIARLAIALQHH